VVGVMLIDNIPGNFCHSSFSPDPLVWPFLDNFGVKKESFRLTNLCQKHFNKKIHQDPFFQGGQPNSIPYQKEDLFIKRETNEDLVPL
jgi:hypothetical protein